MKPFFVFFMFLILPNRSNFKHKLPNGGVNMGILVTTSLEVSIHGILDKCEHSNYLAEEIVCQLHNQRLLNEDVSTQEMPRLVELIQQVLSEPQHSKNTLQQDAWRKARCISHILIDEKIRKGGFALLGTIHTTRDL